VFSVASLPSDLPGFQAAVLTWYDARARRLPFRGTRDPYAILVSEVMAQQTQIGRVGEAWQSFVNRFPTIGELAAASPADVLREWAGLGYNRRAVMLHRAARRVVDEHGGELPRSVEELEALPGIGPYTARAVAAIAFGAVVGAVDTNVRRVLGRLVAGDRGALGAATLQELADMAVAKERPVDWTHALMDIGATFCRPRPLCDGCPIRAWCRYAAGGGRDEAPATRRPAARFPTTSRWLRGRIVDRLRSAAPGTWLTFWGPIGDHTHDRVIAALGAIERDGLLERDPADPSRARLPVGPG
jgi:A/G-specific adenine glycosylase